MIVYSTVLQFGAIRGSGYNVYGSTIVYTMKYGLIVLSQGYKTIVLYMFS